MPERAPRLPSVPLPPPRRLTGIWGPLTIWLTLLALGVDGVERTLAAQDGPESDTAGAMETIAEPRAGGPPAEPDEADGRRWWNLWTEDSTEDRVLWNMWSTHLNRENDIWQNDQILALIYRGFYAGTFRTTHGPQAYTVGVERSWIEGSTGPLFGMVGFRGGFVYGYDRRLGWVAEKYPVLPFAQPVLYGRFGPLTTDFTYTWVVISLTAGLRF